MHFSSLYLEHHFHFRSIRKANSMMALNGQHGGYKELPGGGTLSDKIEAFLESVNLQQMYLNDRRRNVIARTPKRPATANSRPNTSRPPTTASSVQGSRQTSVYSLNVSSKLSVPDSLPPRVGRKPSPKSGRRSTPTSRKSTPKPVVQRSSSSAGSQVQARSKLRQDRNYQAPRRNFKRQTPQPPKPPDDCDDCDEYDDEDDEDDDHEVYLSKRRAWLYDQAIRGRMRQKAFNNGSANEKESSKDSAYGFSGGETSRLHTREPTPDTTFSHKPNRPKILSSCVRTQSRKPHRPSINQNSALPCKLLPPKVIEPLDSSGIKFLNKVTSEILRQGIFSDRGIRKALDNCLELNKDASNISNVEKESLVNQLKQELGLEKSRHQSGRLSATIRKHSTSGRAESASESRRSKKRSLSLSSTSSSAGQAPAPTRSASANKAGRKDLRSHLLNEIQDLDDSIIEDIVQVLDDRKGIKISSNAAKNTRIFDDSLNISNLNVSFNSTAKTKTNTSKAVAANPVPADDKHALLVKSFGRPPNQNSDFNQTPRSSMLYQDSENYEDDKFDSESEAENPQDEGNGGDEDDESIAEEIYDEEET